MANVELENLRERVALACRVLARLDLTPGTLGHVSARIPGTERLLIRAKGPAETGVRYTTADQVIEVDLDGNAVAGTAPGLDVPQEIFIHTQVLKARPDAYAVVHMHPRDVVLFTVCDKPLLPLYGAYDPDGLRLHAAGIPTYDRSILINRPELGDDVVRAMGSASVCLMRGHGITTAGPSIEEAALFAIQLNDLAKMNYRASLLGNPRPISDDDRAAFAQTKPAPASAGGDRPAGRVGALWRYYCARVTEGDPR